MSRTLGAYPSNMLESLNSYPVSKAVIDQIQEYISLLMRWNQKIQMTATKDPQEFVSRHVADSLELSSLLPSEVSTMVDVGSGGGLPGIVLAIANPQVQFMLIEPTHKKHAFLSTARRELGLTNVRTLAVRDEELIRRDDFMPFDAAVARAVWSTERWLERAPRLVRAGGLVYAMEGRNCAEIAQSHTRHEYELAAGRVRSVVTVRVG